MPVLIVHRGEKKEPWPMTMTSTTVLDRALIEHPYRERFRAHHLLAFYRAGRQRESLRSFDFMRKLLVDEIGVEANGLDG